MQQDTQPSPDEPGEPKADGTKPAADPHTTVSVQDAADALAANELAWLQQHAAKAVAQAWKNRRGELRVRVVRDDEMRTLHARHSGIRGTTDVLTFDLSVRADEVDADAVVCADEARRHAEEHKNGVQQELLLYVLHAALHCAGYDDKDKEAYDEMHAREDEILNSIGVGPLFGNRTNQAELHA